MTDCERIRGLIDAGGALDPTAEGFREVAEHAVGCAGCAARLRELRELEAAVRSAFAWADPGDGFDERVLRRVRLPRRPLAARWLVPVAAVAAAVLVVAGAAALVTGRGGGVQPVRTLGRFTRPDGRSVGGRLPVKVELVAKGPTAAFEVVRGAGFALRPETKFRIGPGSGAGYMQMALERGGVAASVLTESHAERVEVAVNGFSVLTNDADFLVETSGNGGGPALYVDRGRVVVSFAGGVSAVEAGEHVELAAERLLSRVRSGEGQIRAELASLERECAELKSQIAQYEDMVRAYGVRRQERSAELELAQGALAAAPDDETARKVEERITNETTAVENLDFVMSAHIAKMSALRSELPRRLEELRQRQGMVAKQTEECRRGLALLAGLR